MTTTAIAKVEAAYRALAEARTVDELAHIRNEAESIRYAAMQAKMGVEMVNDAAELKVRAERRAGELLRATEKAKGAREPGTDRGTTRLHDVTASPTLSDLGVEKKQSAQWQKVAAVSKTDFEQYLSQTRSAQKYISTAGVLRLNRNGKDNDNEILYSEISRPINAPYINTVVCGDCRKLSEDLKDDDVDIAIFDPPYNIGFGKYDGYDDTLSDDEYIAMLAGFKRFKKVVVIQYPEETMRYVVPAFGVPDHVSAWCYNSNQPRRFRLINYYGVVPDYSRIRQPYKNPTDKRVHRLIENGSQGAPLYEWWSDIQIVKNVSKGNKSHPCPMPLKLMERIIILTTQQGEIVLDPFCGIGTTLIAAKKMGRQYIGFELSSLYASRAVRNLEGIAKPMIVRK